MVDVGGGAQPQLGAVLAAGEHDGKVVLAGHEQQPLLFIRQLGNAAYRSKEFFFNFTHTKFEHENRILQILKLFSEIFSFGSE